MSTIEKSYIIAGMGRTRVPRSAEPGADVAALRAFVEVARAGQVGKAAEALGRTQPSISARLQQLEDRWGVRLFRRGSRGMSLTPEGARLLPGAETALRSLEELDRSAGLPLIAARELRIGAGDALGRERLPRAVSKLLAEIPDLNVHIREGPGLRLLEALRDGEIDVALVIAPPPGLVPEGVDLEPLLTSTIEVLAPAGLFGTGRCPLSLEALSRRPLISLQPGSGFRRHIEEAFTRRGLDFRPAVEVGNLSLVRRFVAAGLGVAPVPAIAFGRKPAWPGLSYSSLAEVSPVTYQRARRTGGPLGHAAERLLALLRD